MFIAMELNEIIESSDSINVYNNGETFVYRQQDAPYSQIIDRKSVV